MRSNARKRTGPDSPAAEYTYPVTSTTLNVPRGDQSPKRSRPQPAAPPPRRTLGPARGNLTSGTRGSQQYEILIFANTINLAIKRLLIRTPNSTGYGTRPIPLQRTMKAPDLWFLRAAFMTPTPSPRAGEDYSSKRLGEPTAVHGTYSRAKREPKLGALVTGHGQRFSQLKRVAPSPHRAPVSREGGQMVILKRRGRHSQAPQKFQAYPGEGEEICMVLQQESRLVKPELTAEVKGIYAGLVMVEANCPGVDSK